MQAVITRWSSTRSLEGERVETTWPVLFKEFSAPGPFLGTDKHPGWTPVEFKPCVRAECNIQQIFAVCLDYDGGLRIEEVLSLWSGFFGFLHTTRNHSTEKHRYRLILPFSRPVTLAEYKKILPKILERAGAADALATDGARFWFSPGAMNPETFRFEHLTGETLEPDEWLS